ncbi:MAG: hypothetical protein ACOX4Q_12330 [Syntrophomonadales bacterium]
MARVGAASQEYAGMSTSVGGRRSVGAADMRSKLGDAGFTLILGTPY